MDENRDLGVQSSILSAQKDMVTTNGTTTNGLSNGHGNGSSNGFYQQAKCRLNIIIVGAGIAGLALAGVLGNSGHTVTVLEAAPAIGEVITSSPLQIHRRPKTDTKARLERESMHPPTSHAS